MRCSRSHPGMGHTLSPRRFSRTATQFFIGLGVLAATVLAVGPAHAQTPPTIDGNLSDLIPYVDAVFEAGNGCGVVREDLVEDIINNNFEANPFWPCSGDSVVQTGQQIYFPNGFDQVLWAVAYDRINDQTYLGIRTRGSIGDCNGDSNPDVPTDPCDVPPPGSTTVAESDGISQFDDTYRWNIDDNCDGIFEYRIEVYGPDPNNLTVEVNGVANAGAEAFYNGTELEVRVPGLGLSPIWSASTFVDCIPDALGEDPSPAAKCQEPRPSLEIEKTANPEVICPDEATTFTVTVTNTGSTPLTVSLEDELPADLVYANNVMGDFTFQGQAGQVITFNDLEIPAGASRSVSFDATAGENCFGTVTNTATATGIFQDDCLVNLDNPEGIIQVGPMSATADVECLDDPCVEVVCRAPQAACDGDLITIEADATNCSRGPEDITINIAGQETTFVDVPAGSTVTWSREVTHFCDDDEITQTGAPHSFVAEGANGGPGISYQVYATATNSCGTTDRNNTTCFVECSPEPCISLKADGPPSICDGDDVRIAAAATNCSQGLEDITINIAGRETTFVDVAPGQIVEYATVFEAVDCDGTEPINYPVSASATNSCDTVSQETVVIVECNPLPCVTVECSGPEAACDGDDIMLTATATNCSEGPADITVNIAGQETTFVDVASGAEVSYTVEVTQQCGPISREMLIAEARSGGANNYSQNRFGDGESVRYLVTAYAENVCGRSEIAESECVVECLPEPCVRVDAEGPEFICSGDDVTISASATNCSAGPEDITINIAGRETTFVDVPAGATREYSSTFAAVECVGDQVLEYNVTATAENSCDTVMQSTTVQVDCSPEPCVSIVCRGPEFACEGETITLEADVTNCSTGPETIVVMLGEQKQTFENVPAGESRTASFEVLHECKDQPDMVASAGRAGGSFALVKEDGLGGGNEIVSYEITAYAENRCGRSEPVMCLAKVGCSPQPCIELVAEGPAAICDGGEALIRAKATNCSNGPEDITIVIGDGEKFFPNVPPGGMVEFEFTYPRIDCIPGKPFPCPVFAKAVNECGEVTVEETVWIECEPGPCVDIKTTCVGEACPGAPFEVCVIGTNCGDEPTDITLYVDGESKTFFDVLPGEEIAWCVELIMPECEPGKDVYFDIIAVALNDCGKTVYEDKIAVKCVKPVLEVKKWASVEQAHEGQEYKYTIKIKNIGWTTAAKLGVTDELCESVEYKNQAHPYPDEEPEIGSRGGTIRWWLDDLEPGESTTLTYHVKAKVCDTVCRNEVTVDAMCPGGSDTFTWTAYDEVPIVCGRANCPKDSHFWANACPDAEVRNGELNDEQLTQIAQHVDMKTEYFDWGDMPAEALEGFCYNVCLEGVTSEDRLKREFATLVGNWCAGLLGIQTTHGCEIALDPDTPIDHIGVQATTIFELVGEIDAALVGGLTESYDLLAACAYAINNGQGIPTGRCCDNYDARRISELTTLDGSGGNGVDPDSQVGGEEQLLELYAPAPNPFTSNTRIAYAVPGAGSRVEIGIYNVAGRQVKKLVSGFQSSGRYQVSWDGRDDSGIRMARGVYFIRAFVDGKRVGNAPRVILAR